MLGLYDIEVFEELFTDRESNAFPLSCHKLMLEDKRRLRAMKRAIAEVVRPGDIVVDAGTGTGILALLAIKCGAKRVIAIDGSSMINLAREVHKRNPSEGRIEFIKSDLRRGRLPLVRADVVICELLGQFGIEEGLLPVIRRLRRKVLKRTGTIIPSSLELITCPVESGDIFSELAFWNRRCLGIDFSPFRKIAYNSVYLVSGKRMKRLAEPADLCSIDLQSGVRLPPMSSSFRINRRGQLHGFAAWFRVHLTERVVLSTDPLATPTHWGQVFFPCGEPVQVSPGSLIDFNISVSGDGTDGRWTWHTEINIPGLSRRVTLGERNTYKQG